MVASLNSILENLNMIYSNGRSKEALPFLTDSIHTYSETHGSSDIGYASLLSELGSLHRSLGNYPESKTAYLQSASVIRSILGEDHADYATVLNNLAGLYRLTKEYEKSAHFFEKVLQIYEKTVGKEDYLYAGALNNLALLRQDENNTLESIRLQKQALQIIRNIPGCEIEYATNLNNLAGPLRKTGELQEAERLLFEALSIFAQKTGKKSQLYAYGLNNLAVHFTLAGKFENASSLFLNAIEICKANGAAQELKSTQNNLKWMKTLKPSYTARDRAGF